MSKHGYSYQEIDDRVNDLANRLIEWESKREKAYTPGRITPTYWNATTQVAISKELLDIATQQRSNMKGDKY